MRFARHCAASAPTRVKGFCLPNCQRAIRHSAADAAEWRVVHLTPLQKHHGSAHSFDGYLEDERIEIGRRRHAVAAMVDSLVFRNPLNPKARILSPFLFHNLPSTVPHLVDVPDEEPAVATEEWVLDNVLVLLIFPGSQQGNVSSVLKLKPSVVELYVETLLDIAFAMQKLCARRQTLGQRKNLRSSQRARPRE